MKGAASDAQRLRRAQFRLLSEREKKHTRSRTGQHFVPLNTGGYTPLGSAAAAHFIYIYFFFLVSELEVEKRKRASPPSLLSLRAVFFFFLDATFRSTAISERSRGRTGVKAWVL